MASSTGHPGAVSRETYWRRRAFVLAGIMLALTIIVYACRPSGGENGEPSRSDAGIGGQSSPSVAPTEPSDAESGGSGADGAGESAEPSEGDGGAGGAEGGGSAEGGEESGGEAAGDGGSADGGELPAPERPEDHCRPQDVVVTFEFAEEDQQIYGAGDSPEFTVTVVNTNEQTCTVDVGGKALEIRIHSGEDRIFSTADCVKGEGTDERQLSRGVPYEHTVEWERERSFEDCRGGTSKVKPGWYRANLHGDYVGDQSELVFQLKA
ncbi:hypothetical protein HNR06_002850 [Nocardiopsis arvandica]|uniref:DUF4232 domain-containing protein n=1 Tax=Nocardiopsis sinuspersici TaxID=501010 RepID=A0A7Y9XCG4_9ACTN|nr:hypothetical protein [Nocardiopsis sinuspersici]NYH53261.1 hypothetical protein [Nocardiopsis sinuspersici]